MVACHKLINYDTTILACKENSPFIYQRTGFSSEFYSTCTPLNHLDLMVCPLFFFQKYWHIVSSNVTNAVLSVLHSGHMLHKINYTHIVLIPKKKKKKTRKMLLTTALLVWVMLFPELYLKFWPTS